MVERVTHTESVTTSQPVAPTTEQTVTTTTTQPAVPADQSINVNAPSGTDASGGVTINVPPAGGVTTTTTNTPSVNVNEG